jgi:pimeloyl-ACP methyl ester carboxylesterase
MKFWMPVSTLIFVAATSIAFANPPTTPTESSVTAESLIQVRSLREAGAGVPLKHRSILIKGQGHPCKTLLMFPGLYESPAYLKGLTKYYTSHGFNIVALGLSGHFRANDPEMRHFSYQDWRQDSEEGLKIAKLLGQPIFVFGYSTGGTMAADLALRFPKEIAGLFLFAPALDVTETVRNMVHLGSLLNIQPVDLCNKEKLSPACKAIAHLAAGGVQKARPLLSEGLSWSPFAGLQVHRYVEAIYSERSAPYATPSGSADGERQPDRSEVLSQIYGQITAPTFLVVDEGDLTVATPLSEKVFKKLQGPKDLIVYKEKDGIAHTNITKYPEDTFKGSPDHYNHFTDELEKRMDRFLDQVSVTCEN